MKIFVLAYRKMKIRCKLENSFFVFRIFRSFFFFFLPIERTKLKKLKEAKRFFNRRDSKFAIMILFVTQTSCSSLAIHL